MMEHGVDIQERVILDIVAEMTRIRRTGGRVQTNYYNQCADVTDTLRCWQLEKAIAFQWNDEGVKRVYFYATDDEALLAVLSCTERDSVIDYLTKEKDKNAELFRAAGYKLYLDYGRFYVKPRTADMSNATQHEGEHTSGFEEIHEALQSEEVRQNAFDHSFHGERAVVTDAEEIDAHLREEFDPYEAHFWPLEKLREHIQKGWVWVVKQNGHIIAANLLEIQGRKVYGAFLYNRGDVDVLTALFAASDGYLNSIGVPYAYCWMRLNNKRILRYNIKFCGFVPDGLYDMIYLKGDATWHTRRPAGFNAPVREGIVRE